MKRLFSVDVRSLAAFRIGLGALIALDLALRVPLLEALYTDQGLVPRGLMTLGPLSRTPLDLYRIDGSYAWAAVCVGLTLLCSVCFAIGYRTRWMTVALWVLMTALFRRSQFATDAGDSLVRRYLLWSLFLPLGACWSVDARRRWVTPPLVCSAATAALLLQPALLYFVAGVVKDGPAWRQGYAVLRVLHETEWVRPLGVWLGQQTHVVRGMTFATRVVEIGAPLLLFLPVCTQRVRALGIASLLALQVGLATTLRLNFFPFYASVAWLAFVPSSWWNRASAATACILPIRSEPGPAWSGHLPRAASAFIMGALCVGSIVGLLPSRDDLNPVTRAIVGLGLAQRWDMERYLGNDYVRIHTVGTLASGATVDFRTDAGQLLDSPLEDWARSYRVAVFLEAMRDADPGLLHAFTHFVCERWNAKQARGSELTALTFTRRVIWQYQPRAVPEVVRSEPCDARR